MTTIDLPRSGRLAVVALVWTAATLFGLAVAATTRIGPTVLELSYNHGVHLGDVLAFAGAYSFAAVLTALVLDGPRHQKHGHQKRLGHQNRK